MRLPNLLAFCGIILCCCGCQTVGEFCPGSAVGSALTNMPMGFILSTVCIANNTVYIGGDLIRLAGTPGDYNPKYKTFRASEPVNADMSVNSDTLQFVIDSQEKYKVADYGIASSDDKTNAVGRYKSEKLRKTLVIIDAKKMFIVMYDSEIHLQGVDAPIRTSAVSSRGN